MKEWISTAPFERLLHMEILEARDGEAVLTMPFVINLAQGGGLMHGGALVSLADTAVVMAIKSVIPPFSHFATITAETKYLAPVRQGVVTARARVTEREGRTLGGEAILYNDEEKAVMEFRAVFKIARDSRIQGVTFEDAGKSS